MEVLREVPPVAAAYQATVPAGLVGAVALNTTVPVPHLEADVTAGVAGLGFIVVVTLLLAADKQPVVKLF